jgi:cellulose synthase/poly-beta-1,6-N-acetylglucosamine synthase-like glycosyltransferase
MKDTQFFVSVIIPVHNGERFLLEAIYNVLKQNYHPMEVIVMLMDKRIELQLWADDLKGISVISINRRKGHLQHETWVSKWRKEMSSHFWMWMICGKKTSCPNRSTTCVGIRRWTWSQD